MVNQLLAMIRTYLSQAIGGGGPDPEPEPEPPVAAPAGLSYDGVDFTWTDEDIPEGLKMVDYTNAGLTQYGGIPNTNPNEQVFTVAGFTKSDMDLARSQAIAYAVANPTKYAIIYLPNGNYSYNGNYIISQDRVIVRGQSRAGVRIQFSGGFQQDAIGGYIWFRGSFGSTRAFSGADMARGTSVMTLANADDLTSERIKEGTFVRVEQGHYPPDFDRTYKLWQDPTVPGPSSGPPIYVRELRKVIGVNIPARQITFDEPVGNDFAVNRRFYVQTLSNCVEWVGVENLTIIGEAGSGAGVAREGIAFEYTDKGWIKDCFIENPPYMPVSFLYSRHIEIRGTNPDDCTFSNPQRVDGNYQGYNLNFNSVTDSLAVNCYFRNGRHINVSGQAARNVFYNCRGVGMDLHIVHTGSGNGLVDNCQFYKTSPDPGKSSGMPYLTEIGPEKDNTIHTPGDQGVIIHHSDIQGWKYDQGIRCGSVKNAILSFNRIVTPLNWTAQRNPLLKIYDSNPNFTTWGNHLVFRKSQGAGNTAQNEARACYMDIIPGTIDSRQESGQTVIARQSGVAPAGTGYPALTAEAVGRPYAPPVPSRSSVRIVKDKVYGILVGMRGVFQFGGTVTGAETVQYFDDGENIPAIPSPPPGLESIYLAQLQYRIEHPDEFI